MWSPTRLNSCTALVQHVYAPTESNNVKEPNHSYADDTQVYLALSPNDYSTIDSLCQCIEEINSWMCQNFLQLNKEKTKFIVFGNKNEVLKVNAYLDSRGQTTKNQVKNLGVILESDLSFSSHVKAVTKSVNYHLKTLQDLDVLFPVKILRNLFMPLSPAGWIIVMVSSPAFQRRPLAEMGTNTSKCI